MYQKECTFGIHQLLGIEMTAASIDTAKIFNTGRSQAVRLPKAFRFSTKEVTIERQGQGIGAWVLDWAKAQARAQGRDMTLSALKQSAANRFYVRHGFVPVAQSDFDIDYRWSVREAVAA